MLRSAFTPMECDLVDPFRQAIHGLGRAVGVLSGVPRGDLLAPPSHRAAEAVGRRRAAAVAHVIGELVDPLGRQTGIAVDVELTDGLHGVPGTDDSPRGSSAAAVRPGALAVLVETLVGR